MTKKKPAATTEKKGKMTIMDLNNDDSAGEDDDDEGVGMLRRRRWQNSMQNIASVCAVAPHMYARLTGAACTFICHSTNVAHGPLAWYVIYCSCSGDLSLDPGLQNEQCHENNTATR
jgi:hypothetical protein